MPRRLIAGVLALGVMACNSVPTTPSSALTSFTWKGGAASGSPAAVTALSARGRIDFSGSTDTPTPCYGAVGEISVTGSDVQVRVVSRAISATCVAALGRITYSGVVTLPAGTYALSLVHMYPETGWPTVEAFRQTIKVD